MSFEGVNSVKPEWQVWSLFVLHEIQGVLALDKLEKGSHPISLGSNISHVDSLFDEISYGKAASVIRMAVNFIGETAFREGLKTYLTKFKYSNTIQDDLWRHLQIAYDNQNKTETIDVKKVMDSWTLQQGYPLVTVKRDYSTNKVNFSQSRFLLNNNDKAKLIKTQYEVPITYTTSLDKNWEPTTKFWLHKTLNQSESNIEKELNISEKDWIIANLQEIGYYRVNYDMKNWELLIDQLIANPEEIHQANRIQLLDDLFHLAENGLVEYKHALRALTYYFSEKNPYSWIPFEKFTNQIDKMLSQTDHYGLWIDFVINLINHGLEISRESKNELYSNEMFDNLMNLAIKYGHKSTELSSLQLYLKYRQDPLNNPIPSQLKYQVFCTIINYSTRPDWDFIFDLYKKEQNGVERISMMRALTCSKVPWILNRILNLILDETKDIKIQDGLLIFSNVFNQNYGRDVAFRFLRENWDKIFEIYGGKKQLRLMVRSLGSLNSQTELDEFKDFYHKQAKRSKIGSAKMGFIQAFEQIESNINWMDKYTDKIVDFLKKETQSPKYISGLTNLASLMTK